MAYRIQYLLLNVAVSGLLFVSANSFAESQGPIVPTIGKPVEEKKQADGPDKIDTEVFEIGGFGGLLTLEDFGSQGVVGLKANFHATEDFFLQANYSETSVGKASFETLAGEGVSLLSDEDREFSQMNFLVGYNLFPGEAFLSPELAFNNAFYLVAGVGSTQFAGDDNFTITIGTGYRIILTDWLSWNIDYRDHIFNTEILAVEKTTHNLEFTTGLTFFF